MPGSGPQLEGRRREDRCLTIIALTLTALMICQTGRGPLSEPPFSSHELSSHESWLRAATFELHVNRAEAVEWRLLPGIGPKLSERIVNDRRNRGPFRSIDELQRVKGIGPRTLERMRPWLHLEPSAPGSRHPSIR